jgi:hypothetical protein
MNLKDYQIKICSALLKEKIINSRIELRIMQNQKVKSIKSYYHGLLKRKKRISEIVDAAKKAGLAIDITNYLTNIDTINTKIVLTELAAKLPFDNRRNICIIKLAQAEVPQTIIHSLVKSLNHKEFDRIIEQLPPALLIKYGILKTKDFHYFTKNSIKTIRYSNA